jgi:hypothetical protein
MKSLKKVPGKNKGLSKLPTAVRNKMGYMKKGGKVMKYGGKVVKYQTGGENVLPEVTVVGKKGAGLKERTVVGRGLSGEDYTRRRGELLSEYKDAWLRKNHRHPKAPIPSYDMSMINDNIRKQLIKEGITERGVTNKKTKERLSPEMEEQYRERTARK